MKVETEAALYDEAERLLNRSELIVAQPYMPTDFDWRVGVFDGRPLWACRYYMAEGHWQIIRNLQSGRRRSGRVQGVRVEDVPRQVVRMAVRASALIGDGLYGVDLKEIGRRVYLVEVNDNPSIEVGYEDQALGDELYTDVMRVFAARLEALRALRRG